MFLKRIEISGFKSFAKKTILEFPAPQKRGKKKKKFLITTIVGPNGSGKSNIADAVSWALGAQSMKVLRSKKSEDIIFAGSNKKSQLGSAQVVLIFDNKDKTIPLDFSEIVISRRLFRSGESAYLINGSRVRLTDIVDILAQAGISKDSYCIINQGMSDAVLKATPLERRSILEDAAGVRPYQIKKERSIKKLHSTVDNLLGVKSLILEIEPHLKMLKRQADKTQKYEKVVEDLKEKQLKLYSFLWHDLQKGKNSDNSHEKEMGIQMMKAQREVDKIQDKLKEQQKNLESQERFNELRVKREKKRQEFNEMEKALVIVEGRFQIEKERQNQEEIVRSIPVDLNYVKSKLNIIYADQEKLIARLQKIENLTQLQDIKEFSRAIAQQIYDLQYTVEKKEIKIENHGSRIQTNMSTDNREYKKTQEKYLQKIKQLKQERSIKEEKVKSLKRELEKIEKEIYKEEENSRELRESYFNFQRQLRLSQDKLNKYKDFFNEAKVKMARQEVREEDLRKEIKNNLNLTPEKLKKPQEKIESGRLRQEVERLRNRLEHIGGIDPLVVEEYQETQKRYDFLHQESADLEKAIESLKKIIEEMEEKTKKSFRKTFDSVNRGFSQYFKIIFGGGRASLKKSTRHTPGEKSELNSSIKKDTSLEFGIEIEAVPPGKKISSLAMLSGGERSLTSLALLFAIIAHNPPPFSVLDEVEAALDEINTRRFGKILNDLSQDTQFIIITHNRETMRQATLLYGVTMQDDGVSQLLSVKLDQALERDNKIGASSEG